MDSIQPLADGAQYVDRHEDPLGRDLIRHAIAHARHFLPAQDILQDFIHHNTLHAYQHLSFHEAVARASHMHGANGYLQESQYRDALKSGRINIAALDAALVRRWCGRAERIVAGVSVFELERALLTYGLSHESLASLQWGIDEHTLLVRFREDIPSSTRTRLIERTRSWLDGLIVAPSSESESQSSRASWAKRQRENLSICAEQTVCTLLWQSCCQLVSEHVLPVEHPIFALYPGERTLRDLVVAAGAPDPAVLVHPLLIRFLGSYLDVNVASWQTTQRQKGLIACFLEMHAAPSFVHPTWLRRALSFLRASKLGHEHTVDAVIHELQRLGVHGDAAEHYITRTLLSLPGWSGMLSKQEENGRLPGGDNAVSEFVWLRLVLDRYAAAQCAAEIGHEGEIENFVEHLRTDGADALRIEPRLPAYELYQVAERMGIAPGDLLALREAGAAQLLAAVHEFDDTTRKQVFQEAYEDSYYNHTLAAVKAHHRRQATMRPAKQARAQFLFCIDDREEGFRRYIEACGQQYETFGVAGFFGVAMAFSGLDDPLPSMQCPNIVKPQHAVYEVARKHDTDRARVRTQRRALHATLRQQITSSSTTFVRAALVAPLLGILRFFPLVASILAPALSHRVGRWFVEAFVPVPSTELTLVHQEHEGHSGPLQAGFTLNERVDRVYGTLANLGLMRDFGEMVVILGHGATTTNNPHHAAYECGACGGRNGGPNARALASFANEPEVRTELAKRGVQIPASTWFIGGVHDTTGERVTYYDRDLVPASHQALMKEVDEVLYQARLGSAHERCRKFDHASLSLSPKQALAHVEERSVDISQARPELGHATNACCFVGRRQLTRGLFLDRRAFLVSYDPMADDRGEILARILGAVVPVCGGINLEYYFSTVDNQVWGCGTKLPHNLTGLLGVMEGTTGDLRTGLPRQMIEVHEPMRLLIVVEATTARLREVLGREPATRSWIERGWVKFASFDPETGKIEMFSDGDFRPMPLPELEIPEVATNAQWFQGKREPLAPCRITPTSTSTVVGAAQ